MARFEQVTATSNFMHYVCKGCKELLEERKGDMVVADLDGKPFTDYYCDSCAKERGFTETDSRIVGD